jgi:hypothetical protein
MPTVEKALQGGAGGAGPKHTNATVVSVFVATDQVIAVRGVSINAEPDPARPIKQPDRAKLAEIHPALRTEGSFPLHRFGSEKEFTRWKIEIFGGQTSLGDADGQLPELNAQISLGIVTQPSPLLNAPEGTRKIDGVNVALIPSQRNTPALFGAGLTDRIPDRGA